MHRWLLLLILLFIPTVPLHAQETQDFTQTYYRATVINLEEQIDEESGSAHSNVILKISDEPRTGEVVSALWSNDTTTTRNFRVATGDNLIISCISQGEEEESCSIVSQQRTKPLVVLLGIFILVIWFITRQQGIRAILAMAIGLGIILWGIVPAIIAGYSPLLVSLLGGILIIVPTLYMSHGFRAKSHIALLSIAAMTLVIGVLAYVFSHSLQLIGMNSEETLYLERNIHLPQVLLGAIILGTLGAVDDLALTQISIVNELYHSNKSLSSTSLYQRAMRIGQDHIASVINTLFLAYVGVSLPLLLLMEQTQLPAFVAIQQEQVATEILRTAVGTIGLILVVPLATYLASLIITRSPHLFPTEDHHHSH